MNSYKSFICKISAMVFCSIFVSELQAAYTRTLDSLFSDAHKGFEDAFDKFVFVHDLDPFDAVDSLHSLIEKTLVLDAKVEILRKHQHKARFSTAIHAFSELVDDVEYYARRWVHQFRRKMDADL